MKTVTREGYNFYNDYLGLKLLYEKGIPFNPTKEYISQESYETHQSVNLFERLARDFYAIGRQVLHTGFITTTNFDIFKLYERQSRIEEMHKSRMKIVAGLKYHIEQEIDNLLNGRHKDELVNFSTRMVTFAGEYPDILKYRRKWRLSLELILVIDSVTHFIDKIDETKLTKLQKRDILILKGYRTTLPIDLEVKRVVLKLLIY